MKLLAVAALLLAFLVSSLGCGILPTDTVAEPTPTRPVANPPAKTPQKAAPTPAASPSAPAVKHAATPNPSPTSTRSPALGTSSGRSILFARGNDIWRIDRENRQAKLIIRDGRHFNWSLDGQRIVFVRGSGTGAEIWVANGDGNEQRRLTENNREDIWPAWSYDGKTISFTSSSSPLDGRIPWLWRPWGESTDPKRIDAWARAAEVWLVNADGSNPRRLAAGFAATWAPENRRLAFHNREGDSEACIAIINSEGRNEWRLAASTPMEGPVSGGLFYGQSAWSPDGRDVIYGVSGYAMLSDWGLLRQAATLSKAPVTVVGQVNGYSARVAYSPDGQFLATDYYGSSGKGPTDGLAVFRLGQPSTGNFYTEPIQMTATRVLNVPSAHSPAWSPDGRLLAYVAGNSIWIWDRSSLQLSRLVDNVDLDAGLSWGG